MYTSHKFVIVQKVSITKLNRFSNAHDISKLKKGDKIKLNLRFYICARSKSPRFCVDGIFLMD